jgi:hypothetical protein
MQNIFLTISSIIALSIIFGTLLAMIILFTEHQKVKLPINTTLNALWIVAGITFILILIRIALTDEYDKYLPPIGILLASLIASASVMKSIKANKELKIQEITAEHKRQLTFMFHILLKIEMHIKVIRHSLEDETKKEDVTTDNFKKIFTLLEKITDYKFFTFLANKQYFEFFNLESSLQNLNTYLLTEATDNDNSNSKVFQVEMQVVSVRDMIVKQLNEIEEKR